MKITRKEFSHPSGNWSKGFLWWGDSTTTEKKTWVAKTISEVRQEVVDFVNTISPEKLVSINEYTTHKTVFGDDKVIHFVVWYWEEEVPTSE
jgi:hypothetical protein